MRDKKRTFEKEIQIKSNCNPTVMMEFGELFFEIGTHLTNDVVEGVVLLMNANNVSEDIWSIKINNKTEVSPIKSLYWITGGDNVWGTTKNKINGWSICGNIMADEFGDDIKNIVASSMTLGDVKNALNNKMMCISVDVKQYYKYC